MRKPGVRLAAAGAAVFGLSLGLADGAAATPILEQISPSAVQYVDQSDFDVMAFSVVGDVTAVLQAVDAFSTDSGCEAADFLGFTVGGIALVRRGTCTFELKAENAAAAGAAGVLIFNNVSGLFFGTLTENYTGGIQVFSITDALGAQFLAITAPVTIHMRTEASDLNPVPEPGTLLLLGAGLAFATTRLRSRSNSTR